MDMVSWAKPAVNNKDFKIDFIGVGAEKTGSSWLFRCLSEHPQICGAKGKETTFFDTTKILGRLPREKSLYEKRGIEAYEHFFDHCPTNIIKGEFTTTYLHDKSVAKKIHDNFPEAKILINLRNPVDKAFAMYIGARDSHQYRTFEEALEKEPEFIRRSMYAEYVEEYLKFFPREQVYISFFDDLETNPLLFIQKIYKFLGVDSSFIPPSLRNQVDSEKMKTLTFVRNDLFKLTLMKKMAGLIRFLRLNGMLKKLMLLAIPTPVINPETRKILKHKFLKDIDKLEKITGRDLSSWK